MLFSLVFCGFSSLSVRVCVCVVVSLYALPARCFRTARRHVVPRVKVFFGNVDDDDVAGTERLVVARGEFRPRRALPLSLTLSLTLFSFSRVN